MSVTKPWTRDLPGTIIRIALLPSGRLLVLHRLEAYGECALVCLSEDGSEALWERHLKPPPAREGAIQYRRTRWTVRVGPEGLVWVGYPEELRAYNQDGEQQLTLPLKLKDKESFNTFVVGHECVYVALGAPSIGRGKKTPCLPRLVKLRFTGQPRWSTKIKAGEVAFKGIVRMSRENDWKAKQAPAWQPESWEPDYFDPLVVYGHHILATYSEERSGIARSYCLDERTGQVRWASEPGPSGRSGVDGRGNFLIGNQGYGAFSLERRSTSGELLGTYRTHGPLLVTPSGVHVMEMDNSAGGGCFVRLKEGASVQRGPRLGGYYTAYPCADDSGTCFVVRNGQLVGIDQNLKSTVLYEGPEIPNHSNSLVLTRTLLSGRGDLWVGADKTLLRFQGSFSALAETPWPCGNGCVNDNPFVAEHESEST